MQSWPKSIRKIYIYVSLVLQKILKRWLTLVHPLPAASSRFWCTIKYFSLKWRQTLQILSSNSDKAKRWCTKSANTGTLLSGCACLLICISCLISENQSRQRFKLEREKGKKNNTISYSEYWWYHYAVIRDADYEVALFLFEYECRIPAHAISPPASPKSTVPVSMALIS